MKSADMLIISPPAIRPTSPPLAPAVLKAFLTHKIPQAQFEALDLNLLFFQSALREIERGSIKLQLYDWGHEKSARQVLKAAEYLNSTTPTPEEIRPFHHFATIFLSFERILSAFMADMAMKLTAGYEIPVRITRLIEGLAAEIIERKPKVAAFSVLFDCQMEMAVALAALLKRATPYTFIVFGGARFGVDPHPERLFECRIEIRHSNEEKRSVVPHEFIDAVVAGEGEAALLHIIEAILSGREEEISSAPNLIYKEGSKVRKNEPAPAPSLEDMPPPDFSDLSLDSYLVPEPVLPYMSARGCPWGRCSFCTHHHSYLKYRQRPIDLVVSDLGLLKERYNCRRFNLVDEMIPPARFRGLSNSIKEAGLSICYSAYAKPVKAFDRKLLSKGAESGCGLMLWGVESASQRVLDLMDKGTKIKEAEAVLWAAAQCGIKNLVFIMFGFPGESREEFFSTISFLERNRDVITAVSKGRFILLEGSRIFERPETFGITSIKKAERIPALSIPTFDYDIDSGMSRGEVEQLYRENLKGMESIGLSPRLGAYRDHLLLLACSAAHNG